MTIPSFVGAYQPPGTYVQDTTTPLITAPGVPNQTLALIGPGLGFRSATESFLISVNTAYELSFTGVFTSAVAGPPAIAAPVVTKPDGTVLTAGTDYSLTTVPAPSGNAALAITTVNRVGTSSNISDGQQVSITFSYADVTYYQPQVFTDYTSVTNAYGPSLLSAAPSAPGSSQVANPLSYAAQVAFSNGANTLIMVALNPSDGTLQQQLQAAYSKITTMYAATILVPVFTDDLTTGSGTVASFAEALANDLDNACVSASVQGYPRIGIFGLPRNYGEADIPPGSFAKSISSKRTMMAYPEIVQVFNGQTNQVFNAAGCYLAAALGARLSSLPVAQGLTRQLLDGFSGLTPSENAFMTP